MKKCQVLIMLLYYQSHIVLENWTNTIYNKRGKVKVLQGLIQADFQGGGPLIHAATWATTKHV